MHLPLERDYPLLLNKRTCISHLPKDDLCKVCSKLAQRFWGRRFLNDPTQLVHFCDYLPFEEDLVLYLNKLESPSPKDNWYQVWLNLACWFWRRFLKIFSVLLLFRYYSPLKMGYLFLLNKLESPLSKDDLCQVWLKLAQWFWRKSWKCKSLQTDRQTDGQTERRRTTGDQKSSLELSAKVS
jgi:hypothetical protein